jgi:hypothetical protein
MLLIFHHIRLLKLTCPPEKTGAVLTNVSNFITELQELLLIPTWSRALDREELESYRQKLQDEAFLEENYEKISLDSVERCGLGNAIAQWEKSGQSSMLILTGINNTEISMIKVHCWLSPLAIEIVDRQRDIRGPWAFFRFHGPNRRTISKAIPVLVAQFLSQNRSTLELDMPTLTSHARAFSRLVNGGTHTDDRNERITDVLCQLLFHVVKIFGQKETVTLVIDCLDACDEQERNDFLRMMIGLLNNAGCTVKILVVTQWVSDWRPNERELRSLLKRETPLQFESREQGYLWY